MGAHDTHESKKEILNTCETRYAIGRSCRDCIYQGRCYKIEECERRYKEWQRSQENHLNQIKLEYALSGLRQK